ncbi:SH3 domain-containing protein [Tranquillimonas alkanivorans]|uniref:SH3 domain-containing protein n=1 Tax=Tranquillimonas alkanivorans TaxID=441119 RepID=A0A1I5KCI3_9RHOB|nr:SH3 domain-containing protein [Tranquillimonas alkanivorans]SFO82678.1 SH3 domain-containing protein [Tranquillimonas alkanivorans]
MIRLTLLLLIVIGLTMTIAGRKVEEDAGVEVARLETDTPGLLTASASGRDASEPLALDDYERAVQLALEATEAPRGERLAMRAEPVDAGRPAATVEPVAAASESTEARASEPPEDLWYVTGTRVNLRAGPSTGNPVVGQASLGEAAEMLGQEGSWYRIRLNDNGREAFIYGRYLAPERP